MSKHIKTCCCFSFIGIISSLPEPKLPMKDAEMQARIQRKLELQKKNAKPISFTESLANEQEKQKSLKKSKEERRQAMCEELGRGC